MPLFGRKKRPEPTGGNNWAAPSPSSSSSPYGRPPPTQGYPPRQPVAPSAPPPPAENQFLKRGDELFNEGSYADAIFMYTEALRDQPENALIHFQISIARGMLPTPNLDQAITDVNNAIRINPAMGQAWKQKGELYLRKRDFALAEEAFVVATNMLSGYDKVQAQQALANCRTQKMAATAPAAPLRTSTVLPIRPPSSTFTNPPAPATVSPPRRTSVQPTPPTITTSPPPAPPPRTSISPTPQSSVPSSGGPGSPTISITPAPAQTQPQPTVSPPAAFQAPVAPLSTTPSLSPPAPTAGLSSPTTTNAYQPPPSPTPATRSHVLAQEMDIPAEAPPSYTPAPLLPTGIGRSPSTSAQISSMTTTLATRRQGSLYLSPYTTTDKIDSVQLNFHGKTYLEAILMDLPPRSQVHEALRNYQVDVISYPGTTFIDHDCESQKSYDGYHNGTVTVYGYAEEYREYQLSIQPPLELFYEAQSIPPAMTVDRIVDRLQLLRLRAYADNNALALILGGNANILGLASTTTTAWIQNICTKFHRGQYDAPHRFIDFLTTGSLTRHVFGTNGIGLTNFLFQILLGYELYIRLLSNGNVKYPNIMRATTSALVVISQQFMTNVTIRRNPSVLGQPARYTLVSDNYTRQTQGLISFAEAISWPYLEDLRAHLDNSYEVLVRNINGMDPLLRDWLFGLALPGRYFRRQVMSCLVAASPATKHLGAAPGYERGLVVGSKSWWPKRTVLGSVLGALSNPKCVCGWIGPVPAPAGATPGWYRISARLLDFAMPVVDDLSQSSAELLGLSDAELNANPLGFINNLTDMSKWSSPRDLPTRPTTTTSTQSMRLQVIKIQEVIEPGAVWSVVDKTYRATLDFSFPPARIGTVATTVSFPLYTNPTFVHVPKCAGLQHPMYEASKTKYFDKILQVKDLKSSTNIAPIGTDGLTIIDARETGEEAVARAWCAETGRHAVVRKAGIGCFTCAVTLAQRRTGLGFGVLIWCT